MCHYGSIREAPPLVCGYIVYLFPSEFSWKRFINRSYIIFSTRIHEGRMLSVLFATILLSGPLRGCRVKESACQCRRQRRCEFDPWIMKIPWRRKRQPTPVFLLRKFHGQESLGATVQGVTRNQTQLRDWELTRPTYLKQCLVQTGTEPYCLDAGILPVTCLILPVMCNMPNKCSWHIWHNKNEFCKENVCLVLSISILTLLFPFT